MGIGRISYGLYLYHMPIFQYVQTFRLGFFPTLALEVGITFAVALGSWYLLEQPVQRRVATRWPRASPGDPSGPVATADAVAAVDERIPVPRDPATEPGTDPAERGPGRPVHER